MRAFENVQLALYASGVLTQLGLSLSEVSLSFIIVQPRSYKRNGPVDRWHARGPAILPMIEKCADAAPRVLGSNPKMVVNEGCRDCPGRHACPALQKATMTELDVARSLLPTVMSPEAVGIELRYLKRAELLIKARIDGLEAQGMAELKAGQRVPHFTLGEKETRRRWTKPANEVLALGQLLGIDLAKPTEPITPSQAEKKGIDGSVILQYSEFPKGAIALIEDDGSAARQIFQQ